MAKRTDVHRPGTIIPAHYRYVMSYSLPSVMNGFPVPAFGVEQALKMMAERPFAKTGGIGNCSVCGASYIYGDIWVHEPTSEHIHVGHDCADKYRMMADRSEYELEMGRLRGAAAKEIQKAANAEKRARFLNQFQGLEEALKTDHRIVKDIADRFQTYMTLSEKQVALVFKLAEEAKKPAAEQEKLVPAPATDSRQTFRGTVVSVKSVDGFGGVAAYKMTVKVVTEAGAWLAWGTCPAAILDSVPATDGSRLHALRGATVELTAKLKPGRDAHFAIMNRPIGKLVSLAAERSPSPQAQRD